MNRILSGYMLCVLLLMAVVFTEKPQAQNKTDNTPDIFGYVRAWHQTDISTSQGGFLVKMARMGLKGNVNEYAGYRVFVDFARLGKIKTTTTDINGTEVVSDVSASFTDVLLDAQAFLKPADNLTVSLGQFKVPFGTDNLKSGAKIDFVNRPFITSVAPALRDIGLMCAYDFKNNAPLVINAGVFNGSGQNKPENDKSTNYAVRAVTNPVAMLNVSANYYGGKMSGGDVSIFDFGAGYEIYSFSLNGEYGQRQIKAGGASVKSNTYFITGIYDIELPDCAVTHILPAVRYEVYDPDQDVSLNEVSRITAGASFNFAKITAAQLRINYELYDYKNGSTNPDKLIVEIQTTF